MKTKAICLIALALLAGLTFADGQQTATYDSLNVRVHWTFHGIREFGGLALAPDTSLWTCYPGTNTLIEIDASNPEAIETNFYEMDSVMGCVIDVYHDSILIVYDGTETYQAMLLITINDDPPSVINRYESPYLCFFGISLDRPWIVVNDSILITADMTNAYSISIFDISDPLDIDTFSTQTFIYGRANTFSTKDSMLYSTWCSAPGTEPPFTLQTTLAVTNIADYSNPFHEMHLYDFHPHPTSPEVSIRSVVVDSFLFLAANYLNYDDAPLCDVYNIADPTNPIHTGYIGPHLCEYVKRCMAYQDGYLYAGMYIYDISGFPGTDSLVGYITGQPWEMEVFGKYFAIIQATSFLILEFTEYDSTRQAISENPPPRDTWDGMFLSPNPAHRMCNVRLNSPSYGDISIYNVLGQKVASERTTPFKKEYDIAVSDVPAGLYLVAFQSGSERKIKKLVILG